MVRSVDMKNAGLKDRHLFFVECTFGLPFKYMFAVIVYLNNITQVSTI